MWSLELFSLFFPSLSPGPCYEGRVLELIHSPEELKREKKRNMGVKHAKHDTWLHQLSAVE